MKLTDRLHRLGLVLVPLLFIYAGCAHFASPRTFLKIMPEVIPLKRFCVWFSGLIEIGAGFAYLFPQSRPIARNTLVALLIAVFPANINMAVRNIDFGYIPDWLLWLRLPLQPLLIWLVIALAKTEKSASGAKPASK